VLPFTGSRKGVAVDLEKIKEAVVSNVYHITAAKKGVLHQHADKDEIFYCIKGEGVGVLESGETELSVGKVFIVPAGVMHTVRSAGEVYVASFLIPVVKE
jgi:mannose-6-phosphate isomerase-like protein (cupin superfamily)